MKWAQTLYKTFSTFLGSRLVHFETYPIYFQAWKGGNWPHKKVSEKHKKVQIFIHKYDRKCIKMSKTHFYFWYKLDSMNRYVRHWNCKILFFFEPKWGSSGSTFWNKSKSHNYLIPNLTNRNVRFIFSFLVLCKNTS